MSLPFRIAKKTTWGILLTTLVVGSFVVYAATVDRTVYTTQTLIVIPQSVQTDSWNGAEQVLIQDLSDDALLQDFTLNNAASLDNKSTTNNEVEDDTSEISLPEIGDEDVLNSPESGEGAEPASPDETETLPPPEVPEEPVSAETETPSTESSEIESVEPEPEPVEETGVEESLPVSWGLFPRAEGSYPFAQLSLTSEVDETDPLPPAETETTDESEVTADDAVVETQVTDEPEVTSYDAVIETEVANELDLSDDSTVVESEVVLPDDTVLEEVPDEGGVVEDESLESSTEDVTEDSVAPAAEEDTMDSESEETFTLPECLPAVGCESRSMTFTGFALPEFESGTRLESIQVRLSLAALVEKQSREEIQRYLIEYSYGGEVWSVGSVIDIEEEVSNSINGGYYLITLPAPPNVNDFSQLSVRVSYQGVLSSLKEAFVESVWLEVASGTFYESDEYLPETDAIDYERDLLSPKFMTLARTDVDSSLNTLPSFSMEYDPQQNFLRRVFNALFQENKYEVSRITLTDAKGTLVDVPFDVSYYDDTQWTITMVRQPQKLQPGKYSITVEILENDQIYVDTFEFYWGLLAVNTKKSMYFPNETVELNLAALTDLGDTICDANLELKIIDPKNNIFEVPVEQSGACGVNNVTDIPDYLAYFRNTGEWGLYTIQLQHRNIDGEVVHKIQDSFEVRDYIPFDIERSAPTRIYPPAPYDVTLNIKAHRDFVGDITERVPRGFAITNLENAEISTLPEYTLITWKDVTMLEGDELALSYQFDAPDISPYMYMLGPLDMDGFKELRQWQIASDAVTSVAWLTGTRTVNSTNLNAAASPLEWSTSSIDSYYFEHSTSSQSERLTVRQDGDYFFAVTLPQQRTDGNSSRTRIGVEVRINGVAIPEGLGRSGYIRNFAGHSESSSHANFLLTGLQENDYVEVYAQGLTTIDGGDVVNVTGQAGLYIEYIEPTQNVFSATTTQTASSTNLNQTTASPLVWTETRQDSGFVHSDSVSPENITLSNAGTYLVHVSVPYTGDSAQQSVFGRVRLNGVQVPGGIFAQGYIQSAANESDGDGSIHWSGVVVSTSSNQVLSVTTERDGAAGTVTVTTGFVGTIYIEELASADAIVLRGRSPGGATDWSDTPAETIAWDTQVAYSTSTFTHSTSSNPDDIIVDISGDYLLTYNDAMTSATARSNNRITVQVNGVAVPGAQTKSHYIRSQSGHDNSSGALVFLLSGLTAGQTINILTEQEGNAATIDDLADAIVTLTKKATLNLRPAAPSMYDTPFDNIRFASTTPYFDFISADPDGTFDIQYQFSISTSSDFTSSTTKTSGTDSGFSNTASTTDTSPFTENNKIRFQLQSGDTLTDLTTYYWRVRAKDFGGSGEFGDWSTTQSLTVDLAATTPNWYQTLDGQFESNSLVGTVSSGNNRIQVDAGVSSDVLLVYGEGTVTTPRYRIWDGVSWGVEDSAVAVSNTINWITTVAGVSRDEYVMVTLDQSNDAYAQVYNASSSSWGNQKLLSSVVSSNAYRGVAVAYESLSGDAMAVSCTNGPDPVYSIWNGSNWSATSSVNANSVNNCNFLAIASNPASDEIILVVRDTGTQYEALVWDGSSWVDSRVIGSSALVASEGMSVAYESSGDQAVVTVSNNTNPSILYTTWNGTEWSANTTQAIGDDFVFGRLSSDPDSDNLTLCYIDADADIGALRWDGGVWSTFFELTITGNAATGRPVDCDYETLAGRAGYIMAAYGDTGVDGDYYQSFATSTWSGAQTASNINDAFWVQTERAGNGTIVGIHLDDENDRLESTYWNGTSWDNVTTLETSPSSVAGVPYEMFSLSAKRFQFTEGVVQTPEIDFTFVPNQPTWGDITFSTTEPFGTDVLVRVRYTSTTTCDAYVPDGVLTGNSTGFDVSDAPIDLTSLSTSTYDQICLEATLTTLGSASASLDDWTLSWVREPKLIQQAYRWYVNGSFLTPTDVWPSGGTDVAESTALNSSGPINNTDAIRLRMSLRSTNVDLPSLTDSFKLQYAAGTTCSATLAWADVGNTSSTTALWRGYANSIVGAPDGTTLPTRLLALSDNSETYEESNPTNQNSGVLTVGNDAEWDFALQNNAALVGTNYCFRMVYSDGSTLNSYTNYPRLITNAAPLASNPSAPFDNEQLASTTPWFEFAATDEASDVVSYEIEIDNDYDFGSPVVDRNSVDHFALFTNILNPAERSQYTSGQTIRFIPNTALTNNTTYWWRVRAKDDLGSNTEGDWSTPQSFRIDTATTITTWFQSTGEQFATDSLIDTISSTSTNDIGISTGLTAGTTTSSVIDYDNRETGNAWGALSWTDNESSGTVDYLVEYRVSGETFALIPDADLPGNSSGFNTSPVSLIDLNPVTYTELSIVAVFAGTDTVPRLLDWTVVWGETIEIPSLQTPFDNAKVSTTTPTFTFFTTDPESDDLQYEFQLSSSYAFTSSSTFISGVDAGFSNTSSSTDASPFISGNTIQYTTESALSNGSTYWWRVRARDPDGSNAWSDYATPKSFTVDTAVTVSTWFQTTGEQFETGTLGDIETTAGAAQITTTVNEVLMAYGEGTGQAPRYRIWDGTVWGNAGTAESVGAQIRWTQLKASPTRPEYALGTIGTDADVNVQIYETETDTWGNVEELTDNINDTQQRGFDLAYESVSGDLIAVSCDGLDAVYRVWNGSNWSATSSISLANANNCLYVEMASDPVSDELIAVFKHTNTSAVDYETLVWNGSSWGNSTVFGDMVENTNEGIGVEYEESGGQAIVALSNGALTTLIYNIWNGSAWAGTATTPLGDHIEWASLKRDEGTDEMALCYVDNDSDIGILEWSGSAWGTFAEIELTANGKTGQPIDCEYETLAGRDGYLLGMYSDTGAGGAGDGGKYQISTSTSFGGELDFDTLEDSWRVIAVRAGDSKVHAVFFDDTNDRYDTSQWNGTTWSTRETISTTPSITGTPFDGSLSIAAQIYPNYTSGSIRSTPIDFDDGSGPRWEAVTFSDTNPGASLIEYRLYYLTSSSTYDLIPDSVLPNNSTGFTTSPIDISGLDRTIYETLALDAQFICTGGSCPVLNSWELAWSEGITVSGRAYEFDGTSTTTSGTVAVAVNGVLEVGKTGTIAADGTWSIINVTAFAGDDIVVFVDGATDANEAVGVTTYDGVGNATGMELIKRHLTIGSIDTATTTNSGFAGYDNVDDEDIFFTHDGSNILTVCAESVCSDGRLKVKSGAVYEPGTNIFAHDFTNAGTFRPASTTVRVSGSWSQEGTLVPDTSTIMFTATSGNETVSAASSSLTFNNVTFGVSSGNAIWTVTKEMDSSGTLAIDYGTLARGTSTINVEQNIRIGSSGLVTGIATTTFDGSGSHTWTDSTALSVNLGHVVIDGSSKTITLGGNVAAESITIGGDDTLNASGSGFNINVYRNWVNNNTFIPQAGTVTFVGTTTGTISRGTSAFNNLTFSGVGGNWSFATSTLALNGNLTIATGTVTLPTGTTTIAGSFLNTGGTFAHNNGEVRLTGTTAGNLITQRGTTFLNAFYDLVFTGSGSWSFTENAATTTRKFAILSGTVTLASSTLTVGGDFLTTGSGAFAHNNGEVILIVQAANTLSANGSPFNSLRTSGAALNGNYRTFTDTNLTILGNLTFDVGGNAVLPSGITTIGGSFDNNVTFSNSGGTVRFNSSAGSETIAAGSGAFATVDFSSAGGDFTIIENATATVAFILTDVAQFTLQSGLTFETSGTFTNAAVGANTTWIGSTLLLSGSDQAINTKTSSGDIYGTLAVIGDTDITMWNSSATSYVTASTSSIYSQDHASVDGDLYIFGNYIRTSGTEYWSYATDFDGTALLASTSRQVDVRIATSSVIGLTNASLNMVGIASASSTVDSQSGTFSLNATNTTITAEHFRFEGIDTNGFNLRASTTLATFADGFFTVLPSHSGITIDATTVDTNPSAQFFRIGFATTTAGSATNVTLVGTTTAFVWFRTGTGNLYGEAFDNNDANPGSVRFDDSSNSITVSGTVYADDGVTPLGTPTCDGATPNVRIVVDGGTYTDTTACNAGTGAYTFSNVNYIGDPSVVTYLDTNGGVQGSVVTKTPTANITNMNIYANRVITRHQDTAPLSIADMVSYDYDNDTDISFIASTSSLTVLPNTELFVFASSSFAPAGDITLTGNGNSNSYEGTLKLGAGATFTAAGTETHTLAGRFVMATTSTFTAASSTFVFNATTSGKSITSPNPLTFNQLQFTGVGGGWNITAPLVIQADMSIATGTVTGTNNITLTAGSISGDGTLSLGSGTTTINQSNTLGGVRPWTFANLVLGSGSSVGTTTPNTSATTTVSGRLTISNAHILKANDTKWDLSGTGTVFTETGTLSEDTSTFRYSGANSNVTGTTYYNLYLEAGVGSATYTGVGSGLTVSNQLTVGGAATTIADFTTNDPVVIVGGAATVANNGTLSLSNSATTTLQSDYDNNGTLVANGGVIRFAGSGSSTIAAGASSFGSLVIDGSGSFTVTENATTSAALRLLNHSSFVVNSGVTMAVQGAFTNNLGGGATTWTGSTLSLLGSTAQTINSKTTGDTYEALQVGAGAHVRMWNSSAGAYNTAGGLYSQDHGGTNGLLNVFGTFVSSDFVDHWSYATDFDGTSLSGGNERAVTVAFASSTNATWAGDSLFVIGTSTASTTLQNQGSGTYSLTLGGTLDTSWQYVVVRDIGTSGLIFSGAPVITDFSHTDHLVSINNATALTVGGTVINANEAKNFTNNLFAYSGGVTGAINVTATGTAVSSWRFTNHSGNLAGESQDSDPTGDPGYVVWDDSAALITVSGNVYSDEGVTVSAVCDGSTNNIVLRVAGLTTYSTTCDAGTGAYTIPSVAFGPLDTLTLYIDGETEKAANISKSPVSSISNMHLYENRVIVRHENTDPLSIADMAIWDSSDDADIPFTAVDAGTDTLTLPANRKLVIWNGKTFRPNGNVTLSGGGAGAAYDGSLEAYSSARFTALGTESHSVGGSFVFGAGAIYAPASSTITFTTTGTGRTIDVNEVSFTNIAFTGSGSWTVSDPTLTTTGSLTQSNGVVTYGSGTTTIGAAFNVSGGSFTMNTGPLVFGATTPANTVRFNNSNVPSLHFTGTGSWLMTDTNATTTGSVLITGGTVSLPSGQLTVSNSFENSGGAITHNTSEIIMTATSTANLRAEGSDLFAVSKRGVGTVTMTDSTVSLRDSLIIASGTLVAATGTLSIGGSLDATGGVFTVATNTVLFNATAASKTVAMGSNQFYDVVFGSGSGGWTLQGNATATNNFSITAASSFVKESGTTLAVGGVFTNLVGGAATIWTNTNIELYGALAYTINTKTTGGDSYATLTINSGNAIRAWNSSAGTTTVASDASFYSQDHNVTDGLLHIYGNLVLATTTEYWSQATDFDGTALSGPSLRPVTVRFANNATTTLQSGTLHIGGTASATTTMESLSGTYGLAVTGGTFNAEYYSFNDLGSLGLQISGSPTITNLSNGYFDIAVSTSSLITLSTSALNNNASKVFTNVGFNAVGPLTGYNVNLVGSTSNAWRFSDSYGSIGGEAFDIDGIDACGSIRFDDSACLLTEQTHVRWRNDDGGEGAPSSEWFDSNWDYRQRVRIENDDSQSYATTAIKVAVPYDGGMKADFSDLRFTSSDGLTPISYWLERYTASTDALVWVEVPALTAESIATVFMYYGNAAASSTSSGTSTFTVFDDYEDNNITEYSGDTTLFTTDTTPVFGGAYSLEALNKSGRTTDGIYRTDVATAQGQIIRYMQYLTTAGSGDEACTLFGVQSPGSNNNNYAVCLEQFGTDRMVLSKDVVDNDVSGTVLASSTVTFVTGWYEVEVVWETDDTMDVYLYNSSGTLVATTTATDSSYTTGGIGYTFWFQNGSWDSYTARPIGPLRPTVYLGARQSDGGASWVGAQNAAGNATPGNTKRLRVAIENSGLDITGQTFDLEYAAKDGAPSCEAVASVDFAPVPNQSSCGSSPVCMQTSTQVADGDLTTDLLSDTAGTFVAGRVVESPSITTASIDIDQSYYTEVEYVLTPTINANDSYCFRVTDGGSDLDYYETVAELSLQFDPVFGPVNLNGGLPISLTPGATTTVYATGTVTDFNGVGDLSLGTSTIYRSGAGAACAADTNNCYISSQANTMCSFTNCSSNTCELTCRADIYFNADATDEAPYEGEEWLAYLEVSDTGGGYDFASALGVELYTMRALSVDNAINYGSLEVGDNTGATNASTSIANLGNIPFDIEVEGSDLSDGNVSLIPADQQLFATSTFTYGSCVTCTSLSSGVPVEFDLAIAKPTAPTPPVLAPLYWGIAVPLGVNSAPHQGINLFTPISID